MSGPNREGSGGPVGRQQAEGGLQALEAAATSRRSGSLTRPPSRHGFCPRWRLPTSATPCMRWPCASM
ncbi:hypothetical protein [Paenibacillus senegalimassiliensis]|uniref:hypothetical protein n=1 Tax=Paenibacillus senegalimassiliensis TaxID=1737426 RepID=UPI0011DD7B1F|nr:hypothetical protein [Paenibacillus senegalimassiliensis]